MYTPLIVKILILNRCLIPPLFHRQALCCAWTLDGLHLALGLYNGVITIRDGRAGTEVVSIQRAAPVWALAWCPPGKEETAEQLAVGCWDATLSFYRLNGQQVRVKRLC